MNRYYVVAEAPGFEMEDEIFAKDLYQLARFVRETIAHYRDGIRDTLAMSMDLKFTYKQVLDENDNDITVEAAAAA